MGESMRRLIAFDCAGDTLLGTLDEADGATGLLIVSGGNEIRVGAHRGQALLAQAVAEAGHPVFRYDRRGIGDSEGVNGGFESAAEDLAAAIATFRREAPHLTRIVGFGNCDAASTLALFGRDAGIDALILANPWVIEAQDVLPPPAAIRARYAERLRDPAQWKRLLGGGVDLRKLAAGIIRAAKPAKPSGLADRIAAGLDSFEGSIAILLARNDNTAIVFDDAWRRQPFAACRERCKPLMLDSASHSFAGADDAAWLTSRVLDALA